MTHERLSWLQGRVVASPAATVLPVHQDHDLAPPPACSGGFFLARGGRAVGPARHPPAETAVRRGARLGDHWIRLEQAMEPERSDGDMLSRRTLVGAAAASVVSSGAAAQPQGARAKGPPVWLDMDQKELDDAYDQSAYRPNRDQKNK